MSCVDRDNDTCLEALRQQAADPNAAQCAEIFASKAV